MSKDVWRRYRIESALLQWFGPPVGAVLGFIGGYALFSWILS